MPLITTEELKLRSHAGKSLPRIAKCPACKSDNLFRDSDAGEGPKDFCIDCGHHFAHVPGTITAMQHHERTKGESRGRGK